MGEKYQRTIGFSYCMSQPTTIFHLHIRILGDVKSHFRKNLIGRKILDRVGKKRTYIVQQITKLTVLIILGFFWSQIRSFFRLANINAHHTFTNII